MPLPSSPRLRRMIIAVLRSGVALGGALASASTLGLSGTALGGGTSLVASCDTVGGVSVKYGHTYVPVRRGHRRLSHVRSRRRNQKGAFGPGIGASRLAGS